MKEMRGCLDEQSMPRDLEASKEETYRLGLRSILEQDHYSIGELALLLEVDVMLIHRAIRLGELRATASGSHLGLQSADVLNWLTDGE